MTNKQKLLFVSARFLFPMDCGGKIRTTQVLRGMKGNKFSITLASPGSKVLSSKYASDLSEVADNFVFWPESNEKLLPLTRLRFLASPYPIPVATDKSQAGQKLVAAELALNPDVVVFDFPHAAVLAPKEIEIPSVIFTHNIEAEIFARHCEVEKNRVKKALWKSQFEKMKRFEKQALSKFDSVVAVSARDKKAFSMDYGIENTHLIRTGVDLDFFQYAPPSKQDAVVFVGSMDWLANIDGIDYFRNEVWPLVVAKCPSVRMTIVGRNPPTSLVAKARDINWTFTGYVDDVRPHIAGSSVCVIPLRVGGGTRIKAFEAMAMGVPIVSTSIGIEGLSVKDQTHYLQADSAQEFADCIVRLLRDTNLRTNLSRKARQFVESEYSFRRSASEFEDICLRTIESVSGNQAKDHETDRCARQN